MVQNFIVFNISLFLFGKFLPVWNTFAFILSVILNFLIMFLNDSFNLLNQKQAYIKEMHFRWDLFRFCLTTFISLFSSTKLYLFYFVYHSSFHLHLRCLLILILHCYSNSLSL